MAATEREKLGATRLLVDVALGIGQDLEVVAAQRPSGDPVLLLCEAGGAPLAELHVPTFEYEELTA